MHVCYGRHACLLAGINIDLLIIKTNLNTAHKRKGKTTLHAIVENDFVTTVTRRYACLQIASLDQTYTNSPKREKWPKPQTNHCMGKIIVCRLSI